MQPIFRGIAHSGVLLALLAAPIASHAQVTLFGALANFDVMNDTGQDTHGFEIEFDGITRAQIVYAFAYSRYGTPSYVDISGGVVVRWGSPYDAAAQQYTIATGTPASFAPTFGHSCVGTAIYGCDHYGVSLAYYSTPPTRTIYRWLVDDPANPGHLIPYAGPQVQIPHPIVTV